MDAFAFFKLNNHERACVRFVVVIFSLCMSVCLSVSLPHVHVSVMFSSLHVLVGLQCLFSIPANSELVYECSY